MAVAIGIALKDVVASIIAGVILLFDRPFPGGETGSALGDFHGEIVGIGLRSVRLNTLDDNLVTIQCPLVITGNRRQWQCGALDMMVVTDFYLALDEDIEKSA